MGKKEDYLVDVYASQVTLLFFNEEEKFLEHLPGACTISEPSPTFLLLLHW